MELMKRMRASAQRQDARALASRKRLRSDEAPAPGRALAQRPMSLVFDELQQNKEELCVTSSLVSVARQYQRVGVSLRHYLERRCLVPLHDWQEESLRFAERRERDPEQLGTRSLMLCHQQSLGKTLISLEHCLRDNQARARASGRRFNGATLVLCKDTLLLQSWMQEVASKWAGGAFFYYHLQASGNNTRLDPLYLAHCCDLVFTTYSTLAFAHKHGAGEEDSEQRYKHCVLYDTHWRRIVADEGHLIVNAATRRFRAAQALRADVRWYVSATPTENSWHTICAALQFIGCDTAGLLDEESDPRQPSPGEMERLLALTQVVMLRKLKRDLDLTRDNRLRVFAALTKRIRVIEFEEPLERLVYYMYAAYAQHRWKRDGERTNLAFVQQMLIQLSTNLRILPSLVLPRGMLTLADDLPLAQCDFNNALFEGCSAHTGTQTLEGFAARLGKPTRLSCRSRLRLTATDDYIVEYRAALASPLEPYSAEAGAAPHRIDWDPYAPNAHFDLALERDRVDYEALLQRLDGPPGGARTEAMRQHLRARTLGRGFRATKNRHALQYISESPADDKVIVFSNSIRALHEMARDLTQDGVDSVLVSGESGKENKERLARFAADPACKVLLLSLKLGSMGLNITCANHILFLHPWWNPNTQDHAEERIQRLGQAKAMFIVHFILNDTLELYIASLAYNKQAVSSGLLDERARKRSKGDELDGLSHRVGEYRAARLKRPVLAQ